MTKRKPMSLRERLRACWIILNAPYVEEVHMIWSRDDGGRASRINVGREYPYGYPPSSWDDYA